MVTAAIAKAVDVIPGLHLRTTPEGESLGLDEVEVRLYLIFHVTYHIIFCNRSASLQTTTSRCGETTLTGLASGLWLERRPKCQRWLTPIPTEIPSHSQPRNSRFIARAKRTHHSSWLRKRPWTRLYLKSQLGPSKNPPGREREVGRKGNNIPLVGNWMRSFTPVFKFSRMLC